MEKEGILSTLKGQEKVTVKEEQKVMKAPEAANVKRIKPEKVNLSQQFAELRKQEMRHKYLTPQCGKGMKLDFNPNVLTVGICGGNCSGKNSLAHTITKKLNDPYIVLSEQNFLFDKKILNEKNLLQEVKNTHENKITKTGRETERFKYNLENSKCIDWEAFKQTLKTLQSEDSPQIAEAPIYDRDNLTRLKETERLRKCSTIMVVGRLFLTEETIREMLDFIIFIDSPSDVRLSRILNMNKADYTVYAILDYYMQFMKTTYDKHIEATKLFADVIIPSNGFSIDPNVATSTVQGQIALAVILRNLKEVTQTLTV